MELRINAQLLQAPPGKLLSRLRFIMAQLFQKCLRSSRRVRRIPPASSPYAADSSPGDLVRVPLRRVKQEMETIPREPEFARLCGHPQHRQIRWRFTILLIRVSSCARCAAGYGDIVIPREPEFADFSDTPRDYQTCGGSPICLVSPRAFLPRCDAGSPWRRYRREPEFACLRRYSQHHQNMRQFIILANRARSCARR